MRLWIMLWTPLWNSFSQYLRQISLWVFLLIDGINHGYLFISCQDYPKLSQTYYVLLECLAQDHMAFLATLEPQVSKFKYIKWFTKSVKILFKMFYKLLSHHLIITDFICSGIFVYSGLNIGRIASSRWESQLLHRCTGDKLASYQ